MRPLRTTRWIPRAAVIAVVSLVASLPTLAQAGWTSPVTVLATAATPVDGMWDPLVAVDSAGNSYAAWTSFEQATQRSSVYAVTRTPGGAWSAPSLVASTTGPAVSGLEMAARGNGEVVILLETRSRTDFESASLSVARRAPDGSWSQTAVLPTTPMASPTMAVNPRGDVVVAWREAGGVRARFSAAGGAWGGVENVFQKTDPATAAGEQVEVGISDTGVVTAVWTAESCAYGGQNCVWFNSVRASATNWPRSALTPSTQNVGHGVFAQNGAGDMVFAYTVKASSTSPRVLYARYRTAQANSWAAAQQLSSAEVPNAPRVAITPSGRSTLLWSEWPSTGNVIKGATRARGTSGWTANLNAPSLNGPTLVEAGADESMVGVWQGAGANSRQYFVSQQAPDGTWGQTQPLPPVGSMSNKSAVLDADRLLLAGLSTLADGREQLAVSSFHATAPVLADVTAPATLRAGTVGNFSASVSTWLTPSVTWDFGDGATASGGAVSHAYAKPGTYTITINATDGAGGSVSTTRQVSVAQAGPVLRKFALKRHKIARVGSRSATPRRTRVKVKLSQHAKVRFVVKRAGAKRQVGAFTKKLKKGKSRFWLKAEVGKRKLKPGRYVVIARAKNSNGRSAVKKQKFVVVR